MLEDVLVFFILIGDSFFVIWVFNVWMFKGKMFILSFILEFFWSKVSIFCVVYDLEIVEDYVKF